VRDKELLTRDSS